MTRYAAGPLHTNPEKTSRSHMPGAPISSVALVFGANGISGTAALDVLLQSPSFSKIVAVSRSEPKLDYKTSRISFVSVDLLQSSIQEIADKLNQAGAADAAHAFHYAYIEKSDELESVEVNKNLLDKALRSTALVAKGLKSFLLQTGYKYYGVHKGPPHLSPRPFKEDTPRHSGPNFYFDQEDLIREFCIIHSWSYLITRPNFIIGFSKGNFMNLAVTIAIYAVLCKEQSFRSNSLETKSPGRMCMTSRRRPTMQSFRNGSASI